MWVRSLGWEDPLEEGMATHCGTLARRVPWTEEPGGLESTGSQSRTRLKRLSSSSLYEGFPGCKEVKNLPANAGTQEMQV